MKVVVTIKTVTGHGHEEIIAQEWTDVGRLQEHFHLLAQSLAHEVCNDLRATPPAKSRE